MKHTLYYIISLLCRIKSRLGYIYFNNVIKKKLGYCHESVRLDKDNLYMTYHKMFFYERTSVMGDSKFIISPNGENGRFIMKKHSGAAQGLIVVTGNHTTEPNVRKWMRDDLDNRIGDNEHDVIVEEEVWIGANVILLPGVVVGRGSIIGAGSVLRKSVPPYSIVCGNPAKVVGFKFTPEQVEEHERALYPENEWNDFEKIRKNYDRLFISRIGEIKDFLK